MASTRGSSGQSKIWTPSNIITLFRICLVPVFAIALLSPWPEWLSVHDVVDGKAKAWISAIIFIAISCTDWIDGYLARRRNEVTDFGKFLDPLADKILVAAALIALVELDYLPSWPALIILTREFIVSGIRMLAASKGYVIAASWYGKAKTVLQIIAIVLFIVKGDPGIAHSGEVGFYAIAWVVMTAALIMTIVSMMDYIAKARPLLFPGKKCEDGEALAARAQSTEKSTSVDALSVAELQHEIAAVANEIVSAASSRSLTVGTAESLTGGMISEAITAVPGSSAVINGACITYTNDMKHRLLGVDLDLLSTNGAVSAPCAEAMASGARSRLNADIAISVTGIAGPGGAEEGKPVGTVFMGICTAGKVESKRMAFEGSREEIRLKTTLSALQAMRDQIES